jgi:Skp family chaperone for outer membrane proteins
MLSGWGQGSAISVPNDEFYRVTELGRRAVCAAPLLQEALEKFLLGQLKYLRFTNEPAYATFPVFMNPRKALIILFFLGLLPAGASPRFALVKVRDIYTALPSTIALQEQVKSEREAIMKDERADQLRKIIAELQLLQAQLSDKTKELDETTSRKLARNYEIKRQEAQTLQQEFENFKTEQEKSINKKMVSSMRSSLNRIAETTRKIAKEKGFDLVMDSSGSTNTGDPFVLHSQNGTDLTADVQAAIKDSEPIATPEKPVAKPAPKE